MSYFTEAQLFYLGDGEFELARAKASLTAIVEANMISTDVVEDCVALVADGKASLQLFAEDIASIFLGLAKTDPDVLFMVRGFGEAPHDVWFREYRGGAIFQQIGPPPNAI